MMVMWWLQSYTSLTQLGPHGCLCQLSDCKLWIFNSIWCLHNDNGKYAEVNKPWGQNKLNNVDHWILLVNCLFALSCRIIKEHIKKGANCLCFAAEKVHKQYMSKDAACYIKLPGHTYYQVAIQIIDEVFMKKCPVSCYIVTCM